MSEHAPNCRCDDCNYLRECGIHVPSEHAPNFAHSENCDVFEHDPARLLDPSAKPCNCHVKRIAELERELALAKQHNQSWSKDYDSLAKKLDAAERENAELKVQANACSILRTEFDSESDRQHAVNLCNEKNEDISRLERELQETREVIRGWARQGYAPAMHYVQTEKL